MAQAKAIYTKVGVTPYPVALRFHAEVLRARCRIVSADLEHWRTPSCNDAFAAAPSLPRQRSVAAVPRYCKSAPCLFRLAQLRAR
jgi:hypothetical protein